MFCCDVIELLSCVLPGEMRSTDLNILQCGQSALAVRQRSEHSTFPQRRPMYVWHSRHVACVGKNYISSLRSSMLWMGYSQP